jgi:hypothetical protein
MSITNFCTYFNLCAIQHLQRNMQSFVYQGYYEIAYTSIGDINKILLESHFTIRFPFELILIKMVNMCEKNKKIFICVK